MVLLSAGSLAAWKAKLAWMPPGPLIDSFGRGR